MIRHPGLDPGSSFFLTEDKASWIPAFAGMTQVGLFAWP
ncbi:hypothetical protein ELI_08345 [Erythrobacter litoralis HTCC2594]|uniref:Uncharacterized protein n=1 Tax=Erythrobacter litoralis (strain HTCC2594) TaxID=314225 RepID=Q2N980_ERYLH|nr:hypothetical protein ELI_08345 [Erythrobacter litoralis HTCC2594]